MKYVLAALILAASTLPAIAGQGTTTVCDYRKDQNNPSCSKVYVPDATPARVPGSSDDCAATGGQDGPDGCVVLMDGDAVFKPAASGVKSTDRLTAQ